MQAQLNPCRKHSQLGGFLVQWLKYLWRFKSTFFILGHVLNEPLNVKTYTQHGWWSHPCRLQQDQNCSFKASETTHRVWKGIICILMRLSGCTDPTGSFWTKSQFVGFLVQWLKYLRLFWWHDKWYLSHWRKKPTNSMDPVHPCRLQQDRNCSCKASETTHRVWKGIKWILMGLNLCAGSTGSMPEANPTWRFSRAVAQIFTEI